MKQSARQFHHLHPNGRTASQIAMSMLLLPTFIYIAAVICFAIKQPINACISPLCAVLTIIAVTLSAPKQCRRHAAGTSTLTIFFIAFICAAITLFDDPSSDGNTYHQEIIVYLIQGWNPFYELPENPDASLWSQCYSKGIEIIAACFAKTAGNIEAGKTVNLCLIFGTWAALWDFGKKFFPSLSSKRLLILTFCTIANPVGLAQSLSFCIDFSIYYYILLAIILICHLCSEGRGKTRTIILLSLVVIMSIATKATAFFYTGLTLILAIAWLLSHRQYKLSITIAAIGLGALVACMAFLTYHPFVTNYTTYGNPLYPLAGIGKVDIMSYNTPEIFVSHNRFVNFFISLATPARPSIGTRIGGFGPFAMILFLLSAYTLFRYRNFQFRKQVLYIACCAFASCFIFEQSWWARYIPQFWLVPSAGILAAMQLKWKRSKTLRAIFYVCCFSTAAISFGGALYSSFRQHIVRNIIYETCKKQGNRHALIRHSNPGAEMHFMQQDITTAEVDKFPSDGVAVSFQGDSPSPTQTIIYLPVKPTLSRCQRLFVNS